MKANKFIYGGEVLLDLTKDDVREADVRYGKKFHSADGEKRVGAAIPNDESQSLMPLIATENGTYELEPTEAYKFHEIYTTDDITPFIDDAIYQTNQGSYIIVGEWVEMVYDSPILAVATGESLATAGFETTDGVMVHWIGKTLDGILQRICYASGSVKVGVLELEETAEDGWYNLETLEMLSSPPIAQIADEYIHCSAEEFTRIAASYEFIGYSTVTVDVPMVEVAAAAEMDALLANATANDVGKFYKYTGESTEAYEQGAVYEIYEDPTPETEQTEVI